jgi:hypothetical protein
MGVTNSFEIFEGRLGGGKTYSATLRIIDRLSQGGVVATNIELNKIAIETLIKERYGVIPNLDKQLYILGEEQISDFQRHIPLGDGQGINPLIVMDEFHLWFNSRDYGITHKNHRTTLTFITQARKLHVDLLLISQSALNVDKQFIRQLHGIWRFRDMSKFIIPGLGIQLPFVSRYILGARFDQDGHTLVDRHWIKKDPSVFKCYETTALLRPITDLSKNTTSQLHLDKVQKEPILLRHKKYFIALAIASVVFLLTFVKILVGY